MHECARGLYLSGLKTLKNPTSHCGKMEQWSLVQISQWLKTHITTKVQIYAFLAYKMWFLLDLTLQSILRHKTHCCPHISPLMGITCFCGWISWKSYMIMHLQMSSSVPRGLLYMYTLLFIVHIKVGFCTLFPTPFRYKSLLCSHAWSNQNKHIRCSPLYPTLCPYKCLAQNLS